MIGAVFSHPSLAHVFLAELDWGGVVSFLIVIAIGIITSFIQGLKKAQKVDENQPNSTPYKPHPQSLSQPQPVPKRRVEPPRPSQQTSTPHTPKPTARPQPAHPTPAFDNHTTAGTQTAFVPEPNPKPTPIAETLPDLSKLDPFEFPEMQNLEDLIAQSAFNQETPTVEQNAAERLSSANAQLMKNMEERARASMQKAKNQLNEASQKTWKKQSSIHNDFSEILQNKDLTKQAFVLKEVLDEPKAFR